MDLAICGLLLIGVLAVMQLIAVLNARGRWTIRNVHGGDPGRTGPSAYFEFSQGWAWADAFFWAPIQIAGSIGMVLGERWGWAPRLG